MALFGIYDITSGWREIPPEDKQFLSDLGFDVAAFIGQGAFGCVFSGVCNQYAKKNVFIEQNTAQTSTDNTHIDPVSGGLLKEVSLNGKSCAIKAFQNTNQWTEHLYCEAKVLCDLNHPNIVEIYLICKSENNIYMIMEYLNGGTLKQFLESNPQLDEFSALQLIRQLTSGLQYLHSQDIVHGDLHSENIMIKVENSTVCCKIVDFGNSVPLSQKNNMADILNLAFHLSEILDMSQFVRTTIKANINSVIEMMRNRVLTNMDQVIYHLSRYLPVSDSPSPTKSVLNRFTGLFKK